MKGVVGNRSKGIRQLLAISRGCLNTGMSERVGTDRTRRNCGAWFIGETRPLLRILARVILSDRDAACVSDPNCLEFGPGLFQFGDVKARFACGPKDNFLARKDGLDRGFEV